MKLTSKLLSLLMLLSVTLSVANAQSTSFRARLSEMPVTPQTVNTITGVGEVFLTLSGSTASISGTFEGMSSAASAAHIHNAPKAMNGPPIGALEATAMPNGQVSGELELTAEQVTALQNEEL